MRSPLLQMPVVNFVFDTSPIMNNTHPPHIDLQAAARQTLLEHGFKIAFPAEVTQQMDAIKAHPPQAATNKDIRDLRSLLWSSIDNDTSRDLDQIEVAEALPGGQTKILIGIADVDAFVPKDSAIDQFAAQQTATLYTGVHNFSMLPEELSTGLSSLLEQQDCLAVVIEYVIDANGSMVSSDVYRALVRNQAQLAYNATGAWLEDKSSAPPKVASNINLQAQLKLQSTVAQALREARDRQGALNLETIETHAVMEKGQIVGLASQEKNYATELIEEFMIAANGVIARMLASKHVSSIRRVVRTPKRWDRIVALAAEAGEKLPPDPDSKALNEFLIKRKQADPDGFADLSLAVIKLMGPGEYVLERPGDPVVGHFGLAVQDYTHSTAPNRRFADLVTQRLIKAALAGQPTPYTDDELATIAQHCTEREDAERKVEREMSKRIAAVAMSDKIGQLYDAIVTGATEKGTFVRALQANVEGMLVAGQKGVDVGDRFRVRLVRTDPQHGYIDFARV
jgi:VacB/RNase II family 3'-5' exoribonuclease